MENNLTPDQKQRTIELGSQIKEARSASKKSLKACAGALGISSQEYEKVETGERLISLPELEALAFLFGTPLERFWERETLPTPAPTERAIDDAQALFKLRHRIIGALLRQSRLENGYPIEKLSDRLGIDVPTLEAYELGQAAIPIPVLERLSGILHRSMREFQDQHGPVGEWNIRRKAMHDFESLPLELQVFVSKPVNRPFVELAQRLNDMSVDKLRAVAEGLLEITY